MSDLYWVYLRCIKVWWSVLTGSDLRTFWTIWTLVTLSHHPWPPWHHHFSSLSSPVSRGRPHGRCVNQRTCRSCAWWCSAWTRRTRRRRRTCLDGRWGDGMGISLKTIWPGHYPLVIWHSYGKWPLKSWVFLIGMVIFDSYIGLLEGSILNDRTTECTTGYWG